MKYGSIQEYIDSLGQDFMDSLEPEERDRLYNTIRECQEREGDLLKYIAKEDEIEQKVIESDRGLQKAMNNLRSNVDDAKEAVRDSESTLIFMTMDESQMVN
ncbi:MAG: hypothetical protein OEL87_03425 [Nanoarchaeota archaeon]|nr:hypothetical protein [Nanoarchaeota archaeon]